MAQFPKGTRARAETLTLAGIQGKEETMSFKLKAVGLAALASMAIAGFAAMNASATVSGHFISDAPDAHTIVNQTSSLSSNHGFIIRVDGGARIICEEFSAFGTGTSNTVQHVEGTTTAKGCRTEGEGPEIQVHPHECKGEAWSNAGGAITGAISCPEGKGLTFTHPNCTITAPSQKNITGLTPTTILTNNKHSVTVHVNVTYTVHYEQGICIFLGTKHTASITGSTIIWGQDTQGNTVNITST